MQIALPALIYPPIDSTLRRLALICRPVWFFLFFFFLIASLIMNPTICPQQGKKRKKKKVTAQRQWLKDKYHFHNRAFLWQRLNGLMPPEGLQQFFFMFSAIFSLLFHRVSWDFFFPKHIYHMRWHEIIIQLHNYLYISLFLNL